MVYVYSVLCNLPILNDSSINSWHFLVFIVLIKAEEMDRIDISHIQNYLSDQNHLVTLHYGLPSFPKHSKLQPNNDETASSAIIQKPKTQNPQKKHIKVVSKEERKGLLAQRFSRNVLTTKILSLKDIKHHENKTNHLSSGGLSPNKIYLWEPQREVKIWKGIQLGHRQDLHLTKNSAHFIYKLKYKI